MAFKFSMTIEGTKQGKFKGSMSSKGKGGLSYSEGLESHGFSYSVSAPYDASTGQASGKRQHSPITTEKGDLSYSEGLECHGFSYSVSAPYDASSGLTGKRQHSPITVTQETGVAIPQIFQALVTNEALRPVTGWPNFGLPRGSGGSGSSSGSKPHHPPLTVIREVDEASPLLRTALCTNELLKTVKIGIIPEKPASQATLYYTIVLTNAAIVGIRRVNIRGARRPGEEIDFGYERLETKTGLLK